MIRSLAKSLKSAGAGLVSFARENRGSVSVEFAFIMPLLITLWLGTMEISEGIEVNKKVGRAASTVGDILSQETNLNQAGIKTILEIGGSQLQPYGRSTPIFRAVGVKIDAAGNATVAWSMEKNGVNFKVPLKKTDPYVIPVKVKIPNTFLVEVTAKLEFMPLTSWSIQKNKGSGDSTYAAVDMKEVYYFRPRQEEVLECNDCSATPTNL